MTQRTLMAIALTALMALCSLFLAAPAEAQRFQLQQSLTPDEARDSRRSGETIPVRDAVRIVRSRFDVAELLTAYTVADRDGSARVHVVRIITTDGRRLDVEVNARTGAVEKVG
jgi:uncharacterized membrane protein YkoI